MSANLSLTIHRHLLVVATTAIAIGVAVLLGPGEALLIVVVTLPFTLVLLFVRAQHIRFINECIQQYFQNLNSHR